MISVGGLCLRALRDPPSLPKIAAKKLGFVAMPSPMKTCHILSQQNGIVEPFRSTAVVPPLGRSVRPSLWSIATSLRCLAALIGLLQN